MADRLIKAWAQTVDARGDQFAWCDCANGKQWTFYAINERVQASLQSNQFKKRLHNRLVLFVMPNGVDWIITYLALMHADCVLLPLDPDTPLEAAHSLAKRFRAARLLFHQDVYEYAHARSYRGDLHLVKLTSGTTGEPKALFFTEAQMQADGSQVCQTMGIGETDINFALIPLGHSYGLGNLVIPFIQQGTAVVCGSSIFPQVMADEIKQSQATVFPAVPPLIKALHRSELDSKFLLSLRLIISAGAPLAAIDAEKFTQKFGKQVHSFYGSSETGGIAFDATGKSNSVGTALQGVDIQLTTTGRIQVTSPAVHTYKNRLQQKGQGSFIVADYGEFNEASELILTGRVKDLIKVGGKRVSLLEIEKSLSSLDEIDDTYLEVYTDDKGETRLSAYIVSKNDKNQIVELLRKRLPRWKIPSRIILLGELPYTSRGKIDHASLKKN